MPITETERVSSDDNESLDTEIHSVTEPASISVNTTDSSVSQNRMHDESGSDTSSTSATSRSSDSQTSRSDDGTEGSEDGTDFNSLNARPTSPESVVKNTIDEEAVEPRNKVRSVFQKFSSISDDEDDDMNERTPPPLPGGGVVVGADAVGAVAVGIGNDTSTNLDKTYSTHESELPTTMTPMSPDILEPANTADVQNQSSSGSSSIGSSNDDGDDEDEDDDDEDDDEDDEDVEMESKVIQRRDDLDDDEDSDEDDESDDDNEVDDDNSKGNAYEGSSMFRQPQTRMETSEIIDLDSDLEQPQVIFNPDNIYLIRRSDDSIALGKILQSRKNDEHYVHYIRRNRRLDEWVKSHRIISEKPADREDSPTIKKIIIDSAGADNELCDRKLTRNPKRRHEEVSHVHSFGDVDSNSAALEQEHAQITKVKYIDKLQIGRYNINSWYYSPFPDIYGAVGTIYVCEFCLKYMRLLSSYSVHVSFCKARQPPGKRIYRDGNVAIYEVDGKYHQLYCQLLCLMAKLFLDHKTLYYDVAPFYFYVLCEIRDNSAHIVGYFSKEKKSAANNNVACILILPPYQRNGYGKLLIAFSYELSRRDNVIGSPERPLSDLGRLSYRGYWAYTLLEIMNEHYSTSITIQELSDLSGIAQAEIIDTLQSMKMVKYWKGEHIICVTRETIAEHLLLPQFRRPKLTIQYSKLGWERRKRITLPVEKPN